MDNKVEHRFPARPVARLKWNGSALMLSAGVSLGSVWSAGFGGAVFAAVVFALTAGWMVWEGSGRVVVSGNVFEYRRWKLIRRVEFSDGDRLVNTEQGPDGTGLGPYGGSVVVESARGSRHLVGVGGWNRQQRDDLIQTIARECAESGVNVRMF